MPAGSKRSGKTCSARLATNTTSGRCKISRKQNHFGRAAQIRRLNFRRGCSASADFCRNESTHAQKSSDTYLRRAWDFWWRERDGFSDSILPRSIWKFHGLRPANHPQRRLALASHWLADKKFVSKIENWSAAEISGKRLLDSLLDILQAGRDEFWSWHWTFKSARMKRPQPLLGEARVTDLAVNVILPWLWVRAVEGKNEKIRREMERRFFAWPAAEDNSVLKLARQRLLGTANAKILKTASSQQGLMQIVRDFCGHSNAVCDDCRFPELVQSLKVQKLISRHPRPIWTGFISLRVSRRRR